VKVQNVCGKIDSTPKELVNYFGLTVEIIARMENYSLIRWQERELIVETEDLQLVARLAA
jgi:hypothetical protein